MVSTFGKGRTKNLILVAQYQQYKAIKIQQFSLGFISASGSESRVCLKGRITSIKCVDMSSEDFDSYSDRKL